MKTADGRLWESIHVVCALLTNFPEKSAASVYSLFDPEDEGSAFLKKSLEIATRLHRMTSQKTSIFTAPP
jgi:hypothetical protein